MAWIGAALMLCAAATVSANTRVVTEVRAGDLVVIGESWETRLLGITAPGPEDPIGRQALDFTKRRLEGAVVKLFTYTTDNTAAGIVRGDDGRPFATILCGRGYSDDIAAGLLAAGLAQVDEEHLPESCSHYRAIESEARRAGRGLWACAGPAPM
jgi:endonuclease YncB( thermonuclease family)